MTQFKRRHFLQFSAAALATLGWSQWQLAQRAQRYGRVLAQGTPRKLALLVGINQYSASDRFGDLNGCVNDVELQRQLLIHRFGFQDSDILTLTDAAASRQGIVESFQSHLIDQAQPGDVVVFHFSGHGSRVQDPTPIEPTRQFNSTFVPADEDSRQGQPVKDIMGQTLFLLMYALGQKTENITAVLDSCYSGGGTRGEALVRAAQAGSRASEAEFEFQRLLLSQLNLSETEFQAARQRGIAAGVTLASAERTQVAMDYRFDNNFYAGAFTYLLSQYLWQRTASASETVAIVRNRIDDISAQVPLYETKPASDYRDRPLYFVDNAQPPADAVVTAVQGNTVTLWLGGLDGRSLEAFGTASEMVPASAARGETRLTLTQRSGLQATATIDKGNVAVGELVQEFARAIPSSLQLNVGLDPSLAGDRPAAATALNQLERTQAIAATANGYGDKVHYILGRLTEANRPTDAAVSQVGSIGLFSPTLELVPDSFGLPGEAIASALERLRPKLRGLLATRVISTTLNAQSSQLDVGVTLKLERSGNRILGQAFTFRGACPEPTGCGPGGTRGEDNFQVSRVPLNEPFQLEVINNHTADLYLGVMSVDATGEITILFPNEHQNLDGEQLEAATKVSARSTLLVPDPAEDDFVLVSDEAGAGEMLIIASEQPMTEAFLRLRTLARGAQRDRGTLIADEPTSLIGDFIAGASRGAQAIGRAEFYQMEANSMAAIAIAFEVVP